MKGNYDACLIYKEAETRTAVKTWPINISGPLAAHEEGGSDKSPSQKTHRSNHRPVGVIGERLFCRARGGNRKTSEGIQRNCSNKRDDPP